MGVDLIDKNKMEFDRKNILAKILLHFIGQKTGELLFKMKEQKFLYYTLIDWEIRRERK